jgi:hypothetical protein
METGQRKLEVETTNDFSEAIRKEIEENYPDFRQFRVCMDIAGTTYRSSVLSSVRLIRHLNQISDPIKSNDYVYVQGKRLDNQEWSYL